MSVAIQFAPVDQMTVQLYAQRLRIAAALGYRVTLPPEAARSLAADLDRMIAGAEAYLAAEVARIEAEATEAATEAALKFMADQLEQSARALATEEANLWRSMRNLALPMLAACVMAALIMWGR